MQILIPLAMALVNIPFFPNPLNIAAFGICLGIAIAGLLDAFA